MIIAVKKSNYNIITPYHNYRILYNTLTDSMICFTEEEYCEIENLFSNLQEFSSQYPRLFKEIKIAGFITIVR